MLFGSYRGIVFQLKESRNFHSGNSRNSTGEVFHLVGEFIVHAPRRLIHSRANQILQHLLVFAREYVRLDAHVHNLFLAVHLHRDHSAAGRSFDRDGVHLPLQIFLQLPEPRKHLLESADFHQDSSWRRFTSEILPPKRCSIDRTIGSRSNCPRNSCVPDAARAAAALPPSSLAQTHTPLPRTMLVATRHSASDARP